MTSVVQALLEAGYTLSVDNGGDAPEITSKDEAAILNAMFQTDEEYLVARKGNSIAEAEAEAGWVFFVYGNDGWDVINDHTMNLEPLIGEGTRTQKIIDGYAD